MESIRSNQFLRDAVAGGHDINDEAFKANVEPCKTLENDFDVAMNVYTFHSQRHIMQCQHNRLLLLLNQSVVSIQKICLPYLSQAA
jgi:hypothetical protein